MESIHIRLSLPWRPAPVHQSNPSSSSSRSVDGKYPYSVVSSLAPSPCPPIQPIFFIIAIRGWKVSIFGCLFLGAQPLSTNPTHLLHHRDPWMESIHIRLSLPWRPAPVHQSNPSSSSSP